MTGVLASNNIRTEAIIDKEHSKYMYMATVGKITYLKFGINF